MESPKCPKCGSLMEEGIVRPSGYTHQLLWAELPKGQWIAGTDDPTNPKRFVKSFRCVSCGYLEFYARED